MRGIYTPVTDIRRKVFTEVARMAYNANELSDYAQLMRELPFKIIPGEEKSLRSSIFLERAIVSERIRLAMKAGNTRLVTTLAGQMPSDYQTISTAVISLANDPNSVLTFARSTGATDFTRQMAAVAFASVARDDVENARLMIPQLVQAQQLNEEQTQELRDIVAWRLKMTPNCLSVSSG